MSCGIAHGFVRVLHATSLLSSLTASPGAHVAIPFEVSASSDALGELSSADCDEHAAPRPATTRKVTTEEVLMVEVVEQEVDRV
jgi:hypothetical protein